MTKRPRTGNAGPNEEKPDTRGPSVRCIQPTHELVFQHFVGKLEKLVPLETRAEKPAGKITKPKGQRP